MLYVTVGTGIGGIGIGSTGPVDSVTGQVNNPYTLPGWDNLPLVDHLTDHFHLPAYLLGDCHVAALGEHWAGAGKGTCHMLYVTVGTGIGGGLILDGKLYRGPGFGRSRSSSARRERPQLLLRCERLLGDVRGGSGYFAPRCRARATG